LLIVEHSEALISAVDVTLKRSRDWASHILRQQKFLCHVMLTTIRKRSGGLVLVTTLVALHDSAKSFNPKKNEEWIVEQQLTPTLLAELYPIGGAYFPELWSPHYANVYAALTQVLLFRWRVYSEFSAIQSSADVGDELISDFSGLALPQYNVAIETGDQRRRLSSWERDHRLLPAFEGKSAADRRYLEYYPTGICGGGDFSGAGVETEVSGVVSDVSADIIHEAMPEARANVLK